MSVFKEEIRNYILNSNAIHPDPYKYQIILDLDNLTDISISRPLNRVNWGITVPNNPQETIYVWLDALVNYLSVLSNYFFYFFVFLNLK